MKKFIKSVFETFGYEIRKSRVAKYTSSREIVKTLFRRSDALTIFDVGAHKGESAIFFKSTFKNSEVHSFEPFSDSFKVLSTLNFNGFTPHKTGLSDAKAVESFFTNKGNLTNSMLSLSKLTQETWDGIEDLRQVGKVDCEFTTRSNFG